MLCLFFGVQVTVVFRCLVGLFVCLFACMFVVGDRVYGSCVSLV